MFNSYKLNDPKFKVCLQAQTYMSQIYKDEIFKELGIFTGQILFDLAAPNGLASNRFITCFYNDGIIDSTMRVVEKSEISPALKQFLNTKLLLLNPNATVISRQKLSELAHEHN